jgi:uncharacterized protein (DUF58 family)
MTRRPAPKLGAYAGLGAFGLVAALVLGRPELVALAAPFAVLAAIGLALAPDPLIAVSLDLDRERALEGDEVEATVDVRSRARVEHLELAVVLPPGVALVEGRNPVLLRLAAGERRALELRLRCERWGGYVLGDVALRARDPLGLFTYERRFRERSPLRVYPRPEELRALVPPLETQVFTGNQVSRTKGEGIEFADLRPFVPGDRVRRINWRASARRGALWVNESHPERNTDVIVFLDAFTEARREAGGGTLDMAVRAAATLAGRYLQRKDRVGLVSFGGVLAWLLPATGPVQLYRVVESLIDTEITLSYAWKDVDVIPKRTLPPQALILAVTPLLDERAVGTLLDLRARGFDLVVIEVSPVPFVEPGPTELDRLAHRLWLMKRRALRASYERVGVPVVEWRDGTPLAAPVEEVTAFRRQARLARG